MDKVTQTNASSAEEAASAAEELSAQSVELQRLVGDLEQLVGDTAARQVAADRLPPASTRSQSVRAKGVSRRDGADFVDLPLERAQGPMADGARSPALRLNGAAHLNAESLKN